MPSNDVRAAGGEAHTLWRRARLLVGAVILGLLGWRLGADPFLDAVHVVSGTTVLAAVAVGALTTVLSAWRWALVARGLGVRLPLPGAVGDYYRALFLNAVLPGGVLGDVDRAVRHGRDVGDVTLAVKAVVLERSAGQLVLVTAGAAVLVANPSVLPRPAGAATAVALAAGTLAVVALAVVALARRRGSRWAVRVRAWGDDVRRAMGSPGDLAAILAASAVVLGGHLATFLLAARATGSTLPLTRLALLALVALFAMAVPFNIGGWGPREGATAWAFAAAGSDAGQGLTVALVYGVFAFVASLPGAAVPAGRWLAAARAARAARAVGAGPATRSARPARPACTPILSRATPSTSS